MTKEARKAIGTRGSWFAKVGNEDLPCIHKHWLSGMSYHEPYCEISENKWSEYVDALRLGKAILTTDNVVGEGPQFQRSGYVAVFRVANVALSGRDLTFDLVERLEDLR
ncbi:hypothetical protein J2W51_003961 [Tardiphaga robiniae]|uniref:hypothetical protein n=1 Tax=Tardiphaga robiniae TaxID=943830 RepID=UPI00286504C2|nr:hypothetical protein [Tardiphaga robiniae]MDR6661375.1 hypothetical protein [Tardiphaga robiniae]